MVPRLLSLSVLLVLMIKIQAIAQDCSTPFVPAQFKARLDWLSGQDGASVTATPMVANMNPQEDSIPEIMVVEGSTFNALNNKVLFFRGDGSNADNPLILTVPGNFDYYPSSNLTVGDVDGDGNPEMLVICADRRVRVFTNYTENPIAPMSLWITSADLFDFIDQRPLLADFDADGTPEVYAGSDIYKFDLSNPAAPTLTRIINGPVNRGRAQYADYEQGSCNPTVVDILTVADCNGDPDCAGLELVAGPVIYSIDTDPGDGDGYEITVQRNLNNMNVPATANYRDGYTAVADMDLDGTLDIVVSALRQANQYGVYVWNKNGLIRFFPYPTNPINSGSLACIANVYDDTKHGYVVDFPEILVCSSFNLTCFNLHAAQVTPAAPYWWNLPTSDFSGWTGSTVYDFNADGISEIVYRDESDLRILYGGGTPFPTGVDAERNWFKTPCHSITSDEYPVVADVDNDGETEITVTGRLNENDFNLKGRLRVYESDSGPWVPCRNVWNQFNYFIVNVNDDLSIPAVQDTHHLELPAPGSGKRPLNLYLSQRPLLNENFDPYVPLSDASASVSQVICHADSVTIQLNICNAGDKIVPAGMPITFYQSDPTMTTAISLGTVQWTNAPVKIDSCRTFSFTLPKIPGTVFGVINDDATTPSPFQLGIDFPVTNELECDFLNNLFQFEIPADPPIFDLGPDFGACQDTLVLLNAGPQFASYIWQDGSTNSFLFAQQAGLYWVEATDLCAQKRIDSVWVEVFGYPDIQLDTVNGDCFGKPASVTATAQNAYQPFLYTWSSGDNSASVTGLSDGMYTVTITNSKGCTSIDSTWVEAGGNLQVSPFVAAPILCFGESGALDLSFLVGNPPFNILWSDGSITPNLPNAFAGNYSVTVTDADQCADTVQVSISQPAPLISNGLSALPSCPGLATGQAVFLGAGQATPPYTLLWSNNETTPNLSNLPSGGYQLTVTDANGCTIVENIQVPEYVAPNIVAKEVDVSCFGVNDGSLEVNVVSGSPGFGYLWSTNATTNQIQDLQPGNYMLTLTYADGSCAQTFDFQVTEPLPIILSAFPVPALCNGSLDANIDLTVQNGTLPLSFLWSNNAITEDLTNLGAGAYQVTVTDATTCTEIIVVQVTEPTALLSAGLSASHACPGEANGAASFLGASQGTPPYSLLWSTNETSPNLSNLAAGNYQLTLSDANGCSLVESVQVDEFLPPNVNASVTDALCFSSNNGSILVEITGGSPGFGYTWSNNATTPEIDNLTPGNFTLTLTFADGTCAQTFDYQITEPPALLLIDTVITPVKCFGENNGAIDLSALGGVAPYQFQWAGNQTTEDLNNLAAGNYGLILTDENGCTLNAQFTVPQPDQIALAAIIGADTCQSSNGAIAISPSGGIQPYQYAWSNAATNSNLFDLPAGSYLLTITDANACTEQRSFQVLQHGEIPALNTFTDVITCAKTAVNVGVTVNQSNVQYTWIAPNGSLPNQPTQLVQTAGLYQVTATNTFGCQTSAQLQVMEDVAMPLAEAGPPTLHILCNETTALLDASGSSQGSGYLNRWTWIENGSAVFDTISLLLPIFESGLYIHTVLNLTNGCVARDSILVNWDEPIGAALAVESIRCFGDGDGRIDIQDVTGGNPPFMYSINNQAFSTQQSFVNLLPGTYTLRIRDNFGCAWEHSVELTEPEELSVELTASDTAIFLGQFVQLTALPIPNNSNLVEIDWEPEDLAFAPMSLQQRLRPETHTEFVVHITDQNGCIAEDRIWVSVYNHHIYVPNVILPGSETNTWFTVFAGDGVPEVRLLRIFDRWGEQVFERFGFLPNVPTMGWDGSYRGQPMNPGVFAWYAEVLLFDGRVVFLKGDVTVVR
ncbi:MAG: FG-GAP-like repeat-containing protein [Saprospiraceae bacterium]